MPGIPVLVAALVAVIVGWLNWFGAATPAIADAAWDEPDDVPEREGLP